MGYREPEEQRKSVIERADDRLRVIRWTITKLENERELLRHIQQAAELGFDDALTDLLDDYRKYYQQKPKV